MSTKILTNNVLTSFADLVDANKRRLYRLWLIAPWIGSAGAGLDPVLRIVDALQNSHCRLVVITRPPTLVWHDRAISILCRHPHREVFGCANLHTKLYIDEARRIAVKHGEAARAVVPPLNCKHASLRNKLENFSRSKQLA